jgi:hypothetical protein
MPSESTPYHYDFFSDGTAINLGMRFFYREFEPYPYFQNPFDAVNKKWFEKKMASSVCRYYANKVFQAIRPFLRFCKKIVRKMGLLRD